MGPSVAKAPVPKMAASLEEVSPRSRVAALEPAAGPALLEVAVGVLF